MYPETKGVPLEEMDAIFGEGKQVTARDYLVIGLCPTKSSEQDMGAVEMSTTSESDGATLLQRQAQHSSHPENGTYYPPTLKDSPNPRSSGRGWVGRLFQYKDPGSAPYYAVREEEELAPLHRLHDPDHDDGDDEEDGLGSTDFEMVDREADVGRR